MFFTTMTQKRFITCAICSAAGIAYCAHAHEGHAQPDLPLTVLIQHANVSALGSSLSSTHIAMMSVEALEDPGMALRDAVGSKALTRVEAGRGAAIHHDIYTWSITDAPRYTLPFNGKNLVP